MEKSGFSLRWKPQSGWKHFSENKYELPRKTTSTTNNNNIEQ